MAVAEWAVGTKASDYGRFYYDHCCGSKYERSPEWLAFFGHIAGRIGKEINPKSVLDAGCAKGFLVEMLRTHGMDASGIDISDFAIGQAEQSIRPYLRVQTLTEDLGKDFDLITTIEVVEHMSRRDAEVAIQNMCSRTIDILFSSSPFDFAEPTHINVNPPEYWSSLFERHGFFRDIDYDASYITPWAVRYRKRDNLTRNDLVRSYERVFWQYEQSSGGARRYAADLHDRLAQIESKAQESELQIQQLTESNARLKGDLGALMADKELLSANLTEVKNQLEGMTNSRWWRLRRRLDPLLRILRS
jgi:SAM-dependent methyltransferase